jgi:Rieske Fe-S protein
VISALVAIPLVGSVISPVLQKRKAATDWIELGKTEDFGVGQPTMVQWVTSRMDGWFMETTPRAVWVVKQDGENFAVFNPRCTHLTCAYNWQEKGEHKDSFFCPCHDAAFDINGQVLAGPPPRALDTLPVKVEDGRLFTIYKDFRAGIGDKIEI